MAASMNCGTFSERDDPLTAGSRWEDWNERFDLMIEANGTSDPNKIKSQYLLLMGEEAFAVYKTKRNAAKSDTLEAIKKFMSEHFVVKKCEVTERMVFRRAFRFEDETVTQFKTRLQKLASTCGFEKEELGSQLTQQFVIGVRMEDVERQAVLLVEKLDLNKVFELGLKYEGLTVNVNGLHKPTTGELSRQSINELEESINHLNSKSQRGFSNGTSASKGLGLGNSMTGSLVESRHESTSAGKCGRCGKNHRVQGVCPADGQKCLKCEKLNHFASCCKTREQKSSNSSFVKWNRRDGSSKKFVRFKDQDKKIRFLENEPWDEYSVTKEEYDEYMRYKNSKWMGHIKKENRIHRVNGGPRAGHI